VLHRNFRDLKVIILYGSGVRGDARPDSDIETVHEWGRRFTSFYENVVKEGILL